MTFSFCTACQNCRDPFKVCRSCARASLRGTLDEARYKVTAFAGRVLLAVGLSPAPWRWSMTEAEREAERAEIARAMADYEKAASGINREMDASRAKHEMAT